MLPSHVTDKELSNPDEMSQENRGYVKIPHVEHIVVPLRPTNDVFVNGYDIFELKVLSITGHFDKFGLMVRVILKSGGGGGQFRSFS